MASAASGSDDVRSRSQQPMLASQRAKKQTETPTKDNGTGRFSQFFPLGYKEGFSQWVCKSPFP
jgi:cardiolipin-specific phospholipase